MKKSFKIYGLAIAVLLVWAIFAGIFYYYQSGQRVDQTSSVSQSSMAGWKTYKNDKYSFKFKYPDDTLIYSAIDAKGTPIPPTDKKVCVSSGKTTPYIGTYESDNDDPHEICDEVHPNTTIDQFLKARYEKTYGTLKAFSRSGELQNGDVETVEVTGADEAIFTRDYSEILMQNGSDLIIYSGTYFYPGSYIGQHSPESFSERAFETFTLIPQKHIYIQSELGGRLLGTDWIMLDAQGKETDVDMSFRNTRNNDPQGVYYDYDDYMHQRPGRSGYWKVDGSTITVFDYPENEIYTTYRNVHIVGDKLYLTDDTDSGISLIYKKI